MKKHLLAATTALTVLLPSFGHAEDISERLKALEQEIAILKRKQEVKEEVQKAQSEKSATVQLDDKRGFVVTSPNKDYEFRVRGYAQIDNRTYLNNDNSSNTNQFLVRTARPIFEAKIKDDFSGRLMLDFGGNQTRVVDAYADYKPQKLFNIRVGKFKSPIGLERWQSEQELPFAERGLATNLVPFRDIGVQFYGEFIPQTLEYQVAFTNGTADYGDSNSDTDNAKDVTARVFAHPFRNSETAVLQGLGVGVAGSLGNRNGTTTNTGLTDGYRSNAQARVFTYSTGSIADGNEWRINPQVYYYGGPFGFLGEYVKADGNVRNGSRKTTLSNDAWTLLASYVLTGEDASFEGVKVKNDFDLQSGQWGAWEVLGRVSQLNIDDKAFPIYADPTKSVKEAREYVAGLNWYLNNNLKWNANYAYTSFDGGATRGDRQNEQAIINRLQFRF
jgi:phosphate-selective porin OprO/OprP